MQYSEQAMALFSSPKYFFTSEDKYNVSGSAGDLNIGEYVNLYFDVEKNDNYIESKIVKIRFSVMGGVIIIAAAEKFCSMVDGKSFGDALKYCDPSGLYVDLNITEEKMHSVNFVVHAFYSALESLSDYGCATL